MRRTDASLPEITASLLAIVTTGGYFWVFWKVLQGLPPEGLARDLANQMLGSLTTVWVTLMAYYYSGSSSSAKRRVGEGDVTIAGGGSPDSTRTAVLVDREPVQEEKK